MAYYIKRKYKSYFPFDGWLTKLEMRAFGWSYEGSKTEYLNSYTLSYDESSDKVTAKQNSNHYEIFERISPYTHNPIFIFLEFLMSIFSWIRRKLIYLLFGLTVIGIGLGLFTKDQQLLAGGIGLLAFMYVPSIVLAVLGFLIRVIFRMDSRLEKKVYGDDDEDDEPQYGNYGNRNGYGNQNGNYGNNYGSQYGNYGNGYRNQSGNYGNGYGNPYGNYNNQYGNRYGNYGGQYPNYGNQNGYYGNQNNNYNGKNGNKRNRY